MATNGMKVVLIHGVPRSGTSWLGQIFNAHERVAYRYQPLFSHAFKDRLGPESSAVDLERLLSDVARTNDPFVLGRYPEIHGSYPAFAKEDPATHLVVKHVRYHHLLPGWLDHDPDLRLVAVLRHPCAVLDSWLRAPREFRPEWDASAEWRWAEKKNRGRPEEFNGFEKWKEATRLFLDLARRFPTRILTVRYDDLVTNPLSAVSRLFGFAGLESSRQVRRFLEASRSRQMDDPYAVFKDKRDDEGWRSSLDPAIASAILTEIEGTDLGFLVD